MVADVEAPVEFVLTDKQDGWDKPLSGRNAHSGGEILRPSISSRFPGALNLSPLILIPGRNYVVSGPGRYEIRGGVVRSVSGPPVMVVSDLDGTMVGDDAATSK